MRISFVLAYLPLFWTQAQAQSADGSAQLAGLFVQGCVGFAGNAAALRGWVAANHLPQLPPSQAAAFLGGQSGVVFDASNASGKYALVSLDGGGCAATAGQAADAALPDAVAQFLPKLGAGWQKTGEGADSQDPALRLRRYRLQIAGHAYAITVNTVAPEGPAMLTLGAP